MLAILKYSHYYYSVLLVLSKDFYNILDKDAMTSLRRQTDKAKTIYTRKHEIELGAKTKCLDVPL